MRSFIWPQASKGYIPNSPSTFTIYTKYVITMWQHTILNLLYIPNNSCVHLVYLGVVVGACMIHALALCSFARIKTDWTLKKRSTAGFPGGSRKARDRTDPEGCSSMWGTGELSGVVMIPGWTNCKAKGMCLNVVHGIIVAATQRGDQREWDPLGVNCHSQDKNTRSRTMATVMSSSEIQSKIGQTHLTQ